LQTLEAAFFEKGRWGEKVKGRKGEEEKG